MVRHADDVRLFNVRVGEEERLNLCRIDVLAPADNHIFAAAHDLYVPALTHHGQVTSFVPPTLVDRVFRFPVNE